MPRRSSAALPRAFPGGVLRRLRTGDLAAFQAYRSSAELGRYQSWAPISDAEAMAFLAAMHAAPLFVPGDWVQLAIAEADTDQLIGDIGVFLSADGLTGELGFTLATAAQGRGLATAAVGEALCLLFELTTVRAVLGVTDERNRRSARLLERLGFGLHQRRNVVFRGEACTEAVYRLARGAR